MMNNWRADVYCFQESKINGDISGVVKEIRANRRVKYAQLEARGTRGGIIILWDSSIWEGEVCEVGAYCITCKFTGKTQVFEWHLSSVYAPNSRDEREEVWGELGAVRSLFSGPWVVAGDFNVVRYPSEKKNCKRLNKAMEDFSDFIEDMELQDLPLEGGSFTWRKGDRQDIAARLDRFLISEEWEVSFRKINQSILPRVTSDHNPLLLECGNWEKQTSYFKFENWWLKTQDFNERIKDWWNSVTYVGRPDYILACKLKLLKIKLKEWSKTLHGNLGIQKQCTLNQLTDLDLIQDQRTLSEDESYLRAVLTVELEEIAKREEVAWRQRSRALWLKEGDRNSKYFHRIANCHKRYNNIDKLTINGANVTEPVEIKDGIIRFYQELYREAEGWRPQFNPRFQSMINEEDNITLQGQFEEQEIKNSVFSCAGDKAPGPDGFSMAFYIQCWEVIKEEVVAAIQNFHDQGYFEKSFNATFIALIPKKVGASELKDFRPIIA
ncbi:hypothetical protein MTR67_004862 [Solanum verrucosum]|uniref:Endonuclease/exonuclease/phosphatase domain-containing protein n=1 Tax=Solanum verrucosum TaxID=315347 RepID=A0AAF0PVA9_SOLVR|nr:hypothetical protein MTR67_004862 [Solanum verrucosum]